MTLAATTGESTSPMLTRAATINLMIGMRFTACVLRHAPRLVMHIGPNQYRFKPSTLRVQHPQSDTLQQTRRGTYSVAKTGGAASFPVIERISNGPSLVPDMPGEPAGIAGSEIPLIAGLSPSSRFIAPTGTCPSTT